MTRLIARFELASMLILLAGLALIGGLMVAARSYMEFANTMWTPDTCPVPLSGPEQGCFMDPTRSYDVLLAGWSLVRLVPLAIGVLLALPFVADLERGTYRLAWTQSITRPSWWRQWLIVIIAGGLVLVTLLQAMTRWWLSPVGDVGRQWYPDWFEAQGIVWYGWLLFAIGLTLAVGVLTRRLLVTMMVAGLISVVCFVGCVYEFRLHLVTPVQRVGQEWHEGDGYVDGWYVDRDGKRYSQSNVLTMCETGRTNWEACVDKYGLQVVNRVHPVSHFWPIQFREMLITGLTGLALTGFAGWWVLRRIE